MNMIWFCITSVLVTQVICDQSIDINRIRVFPAENQSIAGVFQVTYLNDLSLPQYAFNTSEARRLCLSLGVNIASKAQVKEALTRGLETCRFGWIDEHFAVIPRRKALSNCGQNQTGLVTWRAAVTQKFDVFCFNESDAAAQLQNTTTESPLNSSNYSGHTLRQRTPKAANTTQSIAPTPASSILPSSSSTPTTMENEAEPAQFVGSAQGSSGAKAILITSTCALLLVAVIILAFIKMRRRRTLRADMEQHQEYIQTDEWTCAKSIKESKAASPEDERTEVDDTTI